MRSSPLDHYLLSLFPSVTLSFSEAIAGEKDMNGKAELWEFCILKFAKKPGGKSDMV